MQAQPRCKSEYVQHPVYLSISAILYKSCHCEKSCSVTDYTRKSKRHSNCVSCRRYSDYALCKPVKLACMRRIAVHHQPITAAEAQTSYHSKHKADYHFLFLVHRYILTIKLVLTNVIISLLFLDVNKQKKSCHTSYRMTAYINYWKFFLRSSPNFFILSKKLVRFS